VQWSLWLLGVGIIIIIIIINFKAYDATNWHVPEEIAIRQSARLSLST
jgi:hypothetical protein